jgi:TrmH family RNA methyltransferase
MTKLRRETGVLRLQRAGVEEIGAALAAGEPVRLLLVSGASEDPRLADLLERARAAGVALRHVSPNVLRRLSKTDPPAEVLALVGEDPAADAGTVLAAGGAVWLLVGVAYPGNTGFAIRTAEVSGAAGIFIDAAFDRADKREHEGRREAVRAAMRADHFMPVFWQPAADVIERARAAGRRVFALEDVGTQAPWEVDLTAPALFVVGGERHGIAPELLERADSVLRIPMQGFIPSYNLQAAMAAVASERLRQLAL